MAGQTLIVRKWSPDFDPMTDVIGSMALWVRICGLPVKYFKSYAVEKIGKILGNVVRVDPITIGQARGKFARVCVEVDLGKPLKPFVEVESVAYNVIYEGISMICFECGCFGHSKDKCPSIVLASNVDHSSVVPNCSPNDVVHGDNMKVPDEMDASFEHRSVIKEDMGPWMLMNYMNKKKNSKFGGQTKSPSKGSRFSVLRDDIVVADDEAETSTDNPTITINPPIVKLWSNLQSKLMNASNPSEHVVSKPSSSLPKSSYPSTKPVKDLMHLSFDNGSSDKRKPMCDVSNKLVSGSIPKSSVHYQIKLKSSSAKQQFNVSKKLSFETAEHGLFGKNPATMFGHSPLEEKAEVCILNSSSATDENGTSTTMDGPSNFVNMTFASNSLLIDDANLPSNNLEGMVVS
ncbi:hypothetical protein ACLB2K_022534 [Fragaria x ananassa]